MDRDEAIRRAEIARIWAEGEMVQWRDVNGGWRDLDPLSASTNGCDFFYRDYNFRIKPKPLECWAEIEWHKNVPTGLTCWSPQKPETGGRWVRMREVTNETDD